MMLATRNVAKNLHERFNELNTILTRMDDSLDKIASSQKEIASSQQQNHIDMIDVLKKIEEKL